jgi:MinD-like ATPase involved in chromosome partitioning or flagellar assembly
VHDREELASRDHLVALGVDAVVESDAGPEAFVRAITSVAGRRNDPSTPLVVTASRAGRVVTVGGPPGVGRTEIAVELAVALSRRTSALLVDVDDVAPAVAPRLHLALEPNLRTAIDAVEHGRGDLDRCVVVEPRSLLRVVTGLPNASAWAQVRPGEIVRVVERLADANAVVVVDGAGMLDDVGTASIRTRFATARTMVSECDTLVAVCDASPQGVGRLLGWAVEAFALAPGVPLLVAVNRAPAARFRRAELYEEITTSVPTFGVVFVPNDARVGDAAWNGTTVHRGGFTRAVDELARHVAEQPRVVTHNASFERAS